MAERGDGCAPHFRVFARRAVAQDVADRFVAHRLFQRALAGDGCLACYLRAARRLYRFAAALLGLAACLCQPLAARLRAATPVSPLILISFS
jgi:hypothetical protein